MNKPNGMLSNAERQQILHESEQDACGISRGYVHS